MESYNSIYYNSPEWVNQIMNLLNPATAYLNQLPQYANAFMSNPMLQGVSNYFNPTASAYNPQVANAPAAAGMTDAAYQQYIAYQQQIADRQYALAVAQMEQQKQAEERAYQLQLMQYQQQYPQFYNGISNFPIGDGSSISPVPISNTPVSTETLNLLKALEPPNVIVFESATVGTVISQGAQQGTVPDTFNITSPQCHPDNAIGCSVYVIATNGIGAGVSNTVKYHPPGTLWYCDGDTPISPVELAITGLKVQRRLVLKLYSSDPSEYKAAIETAVSSGSIPQTESAQSTIASGTDFHALGYQIGEAVKQLVPMLVEQYLEAKYGSV